MTLAITVADPATFRHWTNPPRCWARAAFAAAVSSRCPAGRRAATASSGRYWVNLGEETRVSGLCTLFLLSLFSRTWLSLCAFQFVTSCVWLKWFVSAIMDLIGFTSWKNACVQSLELIYFVSMTIRVLEAKFDQFSKDLLFNWNSIEISTRILISIPV